jgi:hypothetical protein
MPLPNNQEENLQKTAKEMMKATTKVLGAVLQTHMQYILYKEGPEGLKKVEEKMAELGYPILFKEIKNFEYYPIGIVSLPVVIAKTIFHWSDKEIFEMGNHAPKYSAVAKLMLKYFVGLKRIVKQAPQYWKKHNTEGELTCDLDENKKRVVVKLKFDPLHPLFCVFFQGYFLRIFQFVVPNSNITIKETKCMFKGDPYHEYVVRWE